MPKKNKLNKNKFKKLLLRKNHLYGKELKIAKLLELLDIFLKLELLFNIQRHFQKEEEKILKNKKELRLNTLIPLKFHFFECDKKLI